jgi:hypothetical protein
MRPSVEPHLDNSSLASGAQTLGREAVDWFRRPDMLIRPHHLRLSVVNLHHAGLTKAELRLVSKATAVIKDHRGRGIGRG